ncbi:MAG TPA: CDP-diacylglycerol--glycerol-3-phosphate 3-phosphatidyltransferase [Desulfurivibrionaceae bacterium]|nr:CDP-diacylglycerol--glycerol-3-phosphate 3-phosphatidyltransferase [Desulfurivibrionaceae bacterium]
MNLPNCITLIRVLLVPLFAIFVLEGDYEAAFLVFAAAGISDGLDGFLARVLNQKTAFGAVLDPIADKALLMTAFVMMAVVGLIPSWITVLVVSRDVIIMAGIGILMFNQHDVTIRPSYLSKTTTLLQLATIAFALGHQHLPMLQPLGKPLLMITAGLTLLSGAQYIAKGFTILGEEADAPPKTGEGQPPRE